VIFNPLTMLIYAENITPRLRYIAETLLGNVDFTASPVEFSRSASARINYSHKRFSDTEVHIKPCGLLEENGIKRQSIHMGEWQGHKIFFRTSGDLPFDIFSAAFYLLARYEEYLPHRKDSYGRFSHEDSLAFKEQFLQQPLVNLWLKEFDSLLQTRFSTYSLTKKQFSYRPTYDIDIAFRYKGRGWLRKLSAKLKGKPVLVNGKDPFDVYEWLDELHHTFQLAPEYFFLVAKHKSRYDRNLSAGSGALRSLVRALSTARTGLHPSWQSHFDESLVKTERNALERLSGKVIRDSRQHYIMLTLPHTYRSLIDAGIENDHSMGYGSINGFRASWTLPFYWYDLAKEEKTNLLLHPFCYMDANSFFEQGYTPEQAAEELQYYHDIIRKVNGQFITIFHNHFLTEETQWQPWRDMYTTFLKNNFSTSRSPLEL
jgi:hypothetical protein